MGELQTVKRRRHHEKKKIVINLDMHLRNTIAFALALYPGAGRGRRTP
jgi:hypothetical protein